MLEHRDFFPLTAGMKSTPGLNARVPLSDDLPLGIVVTDRQGICLYSNAAYQSLCGWSGDELIGSHWSAVIHSQDREKAVQHWESAVLGQRSFSFEALLELPNGELVWTRRNAALITDPVPGDGYVHTLEDISAYKVHEQARKNAEGRLFEEKERAQVTLDSIGDAVLCTDMDQRVSYMNAVAETMTGFTRGEAMGRPLTHIFHIVDAATRELIPNPAERAIKSGSIVALEANALLINKDGVEIAIEDSAAPIHNRYGVVTGAVIVFHDAQFSRETTSRMAYLARHDALTGLHNRNAFLERFEQSLALALRHEKHMGLLFIDVDNFKDINDALGHDRGDMILVILANKLKACVRATDTVCRYGGDEFVVLLSEIDHRDHAFAIAEKIRGAATTPVVIGEQTIPLHLSIGVSVYPDNGETADALLKAADAAMYRTKALNRQSPFTSLVSVSER